MVRAWIAAVGGKRATKEIDEFIASAGSVTAAARHLSMARATLSNLRDFAAALPDDLRPAPGLSLYFAYILSPFKRMVVEAAVYAVLGRDSTCRVVETREMDGMTLLRLNGASKDELERLGDALWRARESLRGQEKSDSADDSGQSAIMPVLAELLATVKRMELRLPTNAMNEMLSDTAEAHILKKDQALVRTWDQKLVHAAVEGGKKKLLGDAAKLLDIARLFK